MGKNTKPKKMSMAEFMATGTTPTTRDVDLLPSGPKQRGPDDDGSFRRNNMRDNNRSSNNNGGGSNRNYKRDDYGDDESQPQNWRRSSSGIDSSNTGGDVDGGSWRGGNRRSSDRDYNRNSRDYDRGDNRSNNREEQPSRADGDSSWRSGRNIVPNRNSDRYRDDYNPRGSGNYHRSSSERPRLNLSKRTLPIEDPRPPSDTTSKLSSLDINKSDTDINKSDTAAVEASGPPPMSINSRAAALDTRNNDSRHNNQHTVNYERDNRYDRDRERYDNRSFRRDHDNRPHDNNNRPYDNRSYRNNDRYDRDQRYNNRSSYYNEQQERRSSNRGFDDHKRNYPQQPTTKKIPSSNTPKEQEAFPPLSRPTTTQPPPPPTQSTPSPPALPISDPKSTQPLKQDTKPQNELTSNDEENPTQKEIDNEQLNLQKEQEEIVQTFLTLKDEHELNKFTKENKEILSKHIQTITYSLLQKHNNDIAWITSYKLHLQNLIPPDDMNKQISVLFAIQKYCHSIDFPKNKNGTTENLIHTYFQQMLIDDIVSYDSFFEWKDNESKEYEIGKTKAIIQTMDWFNYLEEMMAYPEDDEDEDEEEEEEYDDGY